MHIFGYIINIFVYVRKFSYFYVSFAKQTVAEKYSELQFCHIFWFLFIIEDSFYCFHANGLIQNSFIPFLTYKYRAYIELHYSIEKFYMNSILSQPCVSISIGRKKYILVQVLKLFNCVVEVSNSTVSKFYSKQTKTMCSRNYYYHTSAFNHFILFINYFVCFTLRTQKNRLWLSLLMKWTTVFFITWIVIQHLLLCVYRFQ